MCDSRSIRPLKSVDLDGALDLAARYRRVRHPLWLLTDHIDWLSDLHGGEPDFLMDQESRLAVRPWKSLGILAEDQSMGNALARVHRFLPAADRRRYMRFPARYAFTDETYEGKRLISKHIVADYGDQGWCLVNCRGNTLPHPVRQDGGNVLAQLLFGTLLWTEYMWGATFYVPDHAPFIVPTDAQGALALFKLRDKPADGGRRPALRHWVSEHFRRVPTGNRVGVRTHLRGIEKFHWSGIGVELRPSAYDLEAADRAERPSGGE